MNLKKLRKENRKTQRELAEILNVAQTTYAGYELETSEPTIETLCKLADYYHVSLDYLVGRDFVNDVGYLTDAEKTLLAIFRQLKNENQSKVTSEATSLLIKQK